MAAPIGFVLWRRRPDQPGRHGDLDPQCHNRCHGIGLRPVHVRLHGLDPLLAVSRYGRIRLGRDDDRPDFSTVSWISMMFPTGIGMDSSFGEWPNRCSTCSRRRWASLSPRRPSAHSSASSTPFSTGACTLRPCRRCRHRSRVRDFRKGLPNLLSSLVLPEKPTGHPSSTSRRRLRCVHHHLRYGHVSRPRGDSDQLGLTRVFDAPTSDAGPSSSSPRSPPAFVVSAVVARTGGSSGCERRCRAGSGPLVFVFVFGPTIFLLNAFTETTDGYLEQFLPDEFPNRTFGDGAGWPAEQDSTGLVDVFGALRGHVHGPYF